MPGRLQETVEWREIFPEEMVSQAKSPDIQRQIVSCNGWGTTFRGQYLERKTYYHQEIWNAPSVLGETWKDARMNCTCPAQNKKDGKCIHIAALMIRWEKVHGPWIVKEREWDYYHAGLGVEGGTGAAGKDARSIWR